MIELSADRVAWVAMGAAVTLPALVVVGTTTQQGAPGLGVPQRLALVAAVLGSLAVFAVRRLRAATPSRVVRAGLGLQSVVALALALVETAHPDPSRGVAVGLSIVVVWILLFAALVPLPAATARWGAATAASMWPLAYAVNSGLGTGPMNLGPLVPWVVMNYVAAWLAPWLQSGVPATDIRTARGGDLGGYRLLSRLAAGGMGEVWKADHKLLARAAAVKIIRPEMVEHVGREADMAAARFRREATLIAKLQSPHTVYLYDFGVAQDGRFYYAMELLKGITLEALVVRFGPVPDARAAAILRQVCDSLHEAHEHGMVHRDLKPSNVMLCELALQHDVVKVLDFGLAKTVGDANTTQLTMAGAATGTPGYIAPEIALGDGRVDRRADVYALGCLAYYLLTGGPVFDEANPARLALRHVRETPPDVSARAGRDVPRELEALVLQCLAKSPADRPGTMAEVAERLEHMTLGSWSRADARAWWQAHVGRAGA
jgi:serine/threonine-protein kinase